MTLKAFTGTSIPVDVIKYPITFDGMLVIISDYTGSKWSPYNEWVAENCSGRVCSQNSGEHKRLFVFEDPEDAMAFKLRWA